MNETPPKIALSQIGQIALTVKDLERAIAFYRDRLGLKFLFQAPNVAFFDCNGVRLMLGQSENLEQKPVGTIVYYHVDDLEAVFASLEEQGAAVVRPPHRIAKMSDHDLWMAFFQDSEENVFGLICEKH